MAKTEKETPVRPLVPTGVMTPFGMLLDDPENPLTADGAPDTVWTPGFSDLRVARDKALAEVAQGRRSAKDVPTLPVNVRLVRRSQKSGAPDQQKQMQSSINGYRYVTSADIGQSWFTALPPGVTELPDGSFAKGDCVYMVADAQTAARNTVKKELATQARLSAGQARAEGAGVSYDSRLMEPLNGAPESRVKVR